LIAQMETKIEESSENTKQYLDLMVQQYSDISVENIPDYVEEEPEQVEEQVAEQEREQVEEQVAEQVAEQVEEQDNESVSSISSQVSSLLDEPVKMRKSRKTVASTVQKRKKKVPVKNA